MEHSYSKKSKTFKLQKALEAGGKFSASQAREIFGIGNLAAEVSRIRHNGYPIYLETTIDEYGQVDRKYAMGKASRELVALAYKAKTYGMTV